MMAVASALADIGFDTEAEELLKNDYTQPFSHFGRDAVRARFRFLQSATRLCTLPLICVSVREITAELI